MFLRQKFLPRSLSWNSPAKSSNFLEKIMLGVSKKRRRLSAFGQHARSKNSIGANIAEGCGRGMTARWLGSASERKHQLQLVH
jgi:four helix bundle protein